MRTSTMLKVPAGVIAAILTVASLAPVAQAQNSGFAARMNVPFAFQTSSGQNFAPGVYTIRMNGEHTMVIRGTRTSGVAMTQLANDSPAGSQRQGCICSLRRPVLSPRRLGCRRFEPPSLRQLESGTAVANRHGKNIVPCRGSLIAGRTLNRCRLSSIATALAMSSSDATVC